MFANPNHFFLPIAINVNPLNPFFGFETFFFFFFLRDLTIFMFSYYFLIFVSTKYMLYILLRQKYIIYLGFLTSLLLTAIIRNEFNEIKKKKKKEYQHSMTNSVSVTLTTCCSDTKCTRTGTLLGESPGVSCGRELEPLTCARASPNCSIARETKQKFVRN